MQFKNHLSATIFTLAMSVVPSALTSSSFDEQILLDSDYNTLYVFAERNPPNKIVLTKGENLIVIDRIKAKCHFLDTEKLIKTAKTKKYDTKLFVPMNAVSFFLEKVDPHIDGAMLCIPDRSLFQKNNTPALGFTSNIIAPSTIALGPKENYKAKIFTLVSGSGSSLILIWKNLDSHTYRLPNTKIGG